MRLRLGAFAVLVLVVSSVGAVPSGGLPAGGREVGPPAAAIGDGRDEAFTALADEAGPRGTVRVFVEIAAPAVPEGDLAEEQVDAQRLRIDAATDGVLARLGAEGVEIRRRFASIPFVSLEVTRAALERLRSDPRVAMVSEVGTAELLGDPPPVVGAPGPVLAPEAWNLGADGRGQLVAVIDDGMDSSSTAVHPELAAKVVHEACFVTGDLCPNEESSDVGPGAAAPCEIEAMACSHGTAVASVVAAVAPEAGLVPVNVVSGHTIDWDDVAFALEHVAVVETDLPIAAVNLSLGSYVEYTGPYCGGLTGWEALEAAVANLASQGIAVVAATGNEAHIHGGESIALPACLPGAVAVGATDRSHQTHARYSDSSPELDLWAPGGFDHEEVEEPTPVPAEVCPGDELTWGVLLATLSAEHPFCLDRGTSFAAPHVAAAYAIARQVLAGTVAPEADQLDLATAAFVDAGIPYTDPRNEVTRPKLQVGPAIEELLEWPARPPGSFRPSAADRIVDTALGAGSCDAAACTTIAGNGVPVEVQVTGQGGVPLGASAVLVRLGARASSGSGFLGVNSPEPGALDGFVAYDDLRTATTTVVASLDGDGAMEVVAAFAAVDLQVDVLGWFQGGRPRVGLTPVEPEMIPAMSLEAEEPEQVQVTDYGEVPEEGVEAVVISVLARDADEAGTVTVATDELSDPHGILTVDDGRDAAQTVVVPAAVDGSITVTSDVEVDVVIDLVGWFGAQEGGVHEIHAPLLALDTGDDETGECIPDPCGPVDGTGDVRVKVADVGDVPAEVGAVVLHLVLAASTPALLEVLSGAGDVVARVPAGSDPRSMTVVVAPDEHGEVALRATGGTVEGWVVVTGSFTPPA